MPAKNEPIEAGEASKLVAEYYDPLYRFACGLTGNAEDAADYTQQTFFLLQTKGHQVRDTCKMKSYPGCSPPSILPCIKFSDSPAARLLIHSPLERGGQPQGWRGVLFENLMTCSIQSIRGPVSKEEAFSPLRTE